MLGFKLQHIRFRWFRISIEKGGWFWSYEFNYLFTSCTKIKISCTVLWVHQVLLNPKLLPIVGFVSTPILSTLSAWGNRSRNSLHNSQRRRRFCLFRYQTVLMLNYGSQFSSQAGLSPFCILLSVHIVHQNVLILYQHLFCHKTTHITNFWD